MDKAEPVCHPETFGRTAHKMDSDSWADALLEQAAAPFPFIHLPFFQNKASAQEQGARASVNPRNLHPGRCEDSTFLQALPRRRTGVCGTGRRMIPPGLRGGLGPRLGWGGWGGDTQKMARKHQAPGTGSKILCSGTLEPVVAKKVTDLEMGRVQSQLSSRPGGRDGSGCWAGL